MKKVFVLAGEASGDLHGANLIRHLKTLSHDVEIYGVGGDKIRETGAREFFDLAHFHVTGITDALKRLPQYRRAASIIFANIQEARPDVVVLIDNPGFNLHLAKKIHALGIPIVYYIAPQIWAWAPKRVLKIKKYVQKVLVVFEFEKKIYEDNGIPVVWVGHPLKDLIAQNAGPGGKAPVISLLPGSRKGELKMLFSVFAGAAKILSNKIPGVSFRLIKAPTFSKEFYQRLLQNSGLEAELIEEKSYEAIASSDLAIVCSGTATLECALLGTPMIISNRGTWVTYIAAKILIRVPFIGLPNLVLGEKKIPELLQLDATPKKIALEAERLLKHPEALQRMRHDLEEVSRQLGEPGANHRAAKEILGML